MVWRRLYRWSVMGLGAIAIGLGLGLIWPPISYAYATAASQSLVNEVSINLGNPAGELKFEPSELRFEAGKRYKLVLTNPSPLKHYFTAKDFADAIWTQKVDAGNVEIKGAIHELELRPGATADWVFIPQRPGTYELHCSVAGHTEAGMVGQITVAP